MLKTLITITATCAMISASVGQNTPGTYFVTVDRSGKAEAHHDFGWGGISDQVIYAGGGSVDRDQVAVVCPAINALQTSCPEIIHNPSSSDIVIWLNGEVTEGAVEVLCRSLDWCFVVQNGTERSWGEVSYVAFGNGSPPSADRSGERS